MAAVSFGSPLRKRVVCDTFELQDSHSFIWTSRVVMVLCTERGAEMMCTSSRHRRRARRLMTRWYQQQPMLDFKHGWRTHLPRTGSGRMRLILFFLFCRVILTVQVRGWNS